MPQMLSMKDPSPAPKAGIVSTPAPTPPPPDTTGRQMQPPATKLPDGVRNPVQFDPNEEVSLGGEEVSTVAPTTPAPEEAPAKEEPEQKEFAFDVPEPTTATPKETTPTPPTIPSGPRNYDEFPEELRPVLKALNNQQFKAFAPKLKELHARAQKAQELEVASTQSPKFFYEHPEAYRLDPIYNDLNTKIDYINFEQDHYSKALVAIKRGESWQNLKGYDSRTGEPVFETIQPPVDGRPDYQAETQVQQLLGRLGTASMQKQAELANYQGTYQNSVKQATTELAEIDKRLFPKLHDVASLPPDEKKYYDIATGLTPVHLKNHPLVAPLGKSFVMYMRLLKMYQQSEADKTKLRAQLGDRAAAEPSSIPAGGGIPKRAVKPGQQDPDEEVALGKWDE